MDSSQPQNFVSVIVSAIFSGEMQLDAAGAVDHVADVAGSSLSIRRLRGAQDDVFQPAIDVLGIHHVNAPAAA